MIGRGVVSVRAATSRPQALPHLRELTTRTREPQRCPGLGARACGRYTRSVADPCRRHTAKLSPEALAEQAGIDRQAINRIEQGRRSAILDDLLRIARALGVPLADLVR
jgi:DNA-binding XRE family transcriptional regulator